MFNVFYLKNYMRRTRMMQDFANWIVTEITEQILSWRDLH